MAENDMTEGLWITSDPRPDGSYTLVLSVLGDVSRALTPDEAVRYARAVFAVAAAVDYEQAMFAQLTDGDVPEDARLALIAEMRRERPPIDDEATMPLKYEPGLNTRGKGFIVLRLNRRVIGQVAPTDVRSHATHVIEAVSIAQLDATYRSVLVKLVGMTDESALTAVDRLSEYREEP